MHKQWDDVLVLFQSSTSRESRWDVAPPARQVKNDSAAGLWWLRMTQPECPQNMGTGVSAPSAVSAKEQTFQVTGFGHCRIYAEGEGVHEHPCENLDFL